jgi:penicillin amidase
MDRSFGSALAAAAAARLRPRPAAVTLDQRLAMLPLAGLSLASPVEIFWNDHHVPFIAAATDTDLATALGVVHAHLRLAQIEIMRRVAFGRVAELIGPLGIGIDRSLRLMGLGRAVPAIIAGLPDATREWSEAFVAGLNHHIAHVTALPYEFELLGLRPEPWTLTDLFMLARLVSADIGWLVSARLLKLRRKLPAAQWAALWPVLLAGGAPAGDPAGPEPDGRLLAATLRAGSNSAAVAGWRSASGAAMIASDPHLGLALPNQWLVAGLSSPGVNAVGLMLPGLPFIGLGRNRDIAWGGTSLHAASSDLFDVGDLPPAAFTTREETIRVRWSRPRRLRLRETAIGPVVSDGTLLRNERPLAMRWVGHRASDELTAMLGVLRARDWPQFRAALDGFALPGQTMVFAAADGRVGQLIAAHLPPRSGDPPDLALAPDRAWPPERLDSSADLPASVDPPEGFIASANARPDGAVVGFFFAPGDRLARLRDLLGGRDRLDIAALRRLQQDVRQPGVLPLRDRLLGLLRPRDPREQAVCDALAQWDGSYAAGSRGALLFEALFGGIVRGLGLGGELALYESIWTSRRLLADAIARADPEALRRHAAHALRRLARLPRGKTWGDVHRFRLGHAFAAIPLLGRRFRLPDFPAEGGQDTLNKTGHRVGARRHAVTFGACARHISDLADPDANLFVLLGGQDGWIGSSTFADQIALWRRGDYMTVPLRAETARATFRHHTVLRP